ncbi:MAG: hypothetical protein AB7L66_02535 [Gemmatimonadales bacterium]
MRVVLAGLTALVAAAPLAAQSEDVLRRYFEGKTVLVKLEMPGTEDGVDVYPGTSQPVDFPKHARRLKQYGTAIRRGEEVLITKLKIKKDLIEFQLGGGGYGTFGDETGGVSVPSAQKTEREKTLEKQVPVLGGADKKKAQEELDGLRKERQRIDAANRTQAEQARQLKEANIRQRRTEGGSRFNIRFRPEVPPEAMTPDGVMRALADYVDFTPVLEATASRPGLYGEGDRRPADPFAALHKGLTVEEVDELFGRPETIDRRMEGSLQVSVSRYRAADRLIEAEFVEGVLIRFTVRSQ